MLEGLKPLAQRIREARERLSENAAEIRKGNAAPAGLEEGALAITIGKAEADFSVCAVDGGLLADRFVGSDILVRRAAAVRFCYEKGRLSSVEHYPEKFPASQVDFRSGLDEHEALVFRSLVRLRGEISLAIETVDKFRPDYLLLDGSLAPLGSDRPGDESTLREEYDSLLASYKKLYEKCGSLNCQLVGVIKDSRGKRLAEILGGLLAVDAPDAVLVDALLKEGERTSTMAYSQEPQKHQVLRGLGGWGGRIRLFYMKPSAEDMPLRVEFMQSEKKPGEIASALGSLCSISRAFAYPAALIEADMCAALKPLEMESIKRSLFALAGGAARPLRRAERPFR
jgi:hypothetical protein